MADSADVLARLRVNGPEGPVARLARLAVEDVLGRPVGALMDAALVASSAREAIRALTASDEAAERVTARLERAIGEMAADGRALGAIVPAALRDGARAFAELPVTPRREVVLKLVDREPLKQLLRAQIVSTLVAFGRKAASPVSDNAIARGLGGFSKLVAASPSPFGRVASAVSNEVERQMDRRAADFADTAVVGVLEGIADQLGDPARAKEQAAVRSSLLDGVLELTGADAADLARGHTASFVAVARKALAAWAADGAFAADVEAAITKAVAAEATRPLGDVLGELALRDAVAAHASVVVERGLTRLVAGEPFARWLAELVDGR